MMRGVFISYSPSGILMYGLSVCSLRFALFSIKLFSCFLFSSTFCLLFNHPSSLNHIQNGLVPSRAYTQTAAWFSPIGKELLSLIILSCIVFSYSISSRARMRSPFGRSIHRSSLS